MVAKYRIILIMLKIQFISRKRIYFIFYLKFAQGKARRVLEQNLQNKSKLAEYSYTNNLKLVIIGDIFYVSKNCIFKLFV